MPVKITPTKETTEAIEMASRAASHLFLNTEGRATYGTGAIFAARVVDEFGMIIHPTWNEKQDRNNWLLTPMACHIITIFAGGSAILRALHNCEIHCKDKDTHDQFREQSRQIYYSISDSLDLVLSHDDEKDYSAMIHDGEWKRMKDEGRLIGSAAIFGRALKECYMSHSREKMSRVANTLSAAYRKADTITKGT